MFFGNNEIAPGIVGTLNLFILLFGVLIAWYAMGVVRWDVFLKDAKSRQAAVLRLLLAILVGYQLARFVNEYVLATSMLRQLF